MNRSILKGTPLHQSIVAQTRTKADSTLVDAGRALGESYIPAAIDFSINRRSIKMGDTDGGDEKKNKWTSKDSQEVIDKNDALRDKEAEENQKEYKRLQEERKKAELKAEEARIKADKDKNDAAIKEAKEQEKKLLEIKNKEEELANKIELKTIPKIQELKKLPTNKNKTKLQKTIKTVETKKSIDRFEKAAEEFGYDISTVKGYEKAEKAMEYNDNSEKWINPRATVTDLEQKVVKKSKEELAIEAEVRESQNKTIQKERSRIETNREDRLDKAIAEKNIKAGEKESIRLEKQVEINKKNEAIRARNKVINDAKKYYDTDKINKTQLEAYSEMMRNRKAEENEPEIEIIEEDDPEPELDEYNRIKALNSNTPQNQVTQTEVKESKPLISDFEGNFIQKQKQYKEAMKAYKEKYDTKYGKSPAQMRDNRVYANALKDGPVRKNMIKSGYKPQ